MKKVFILLIALACLAGLYALVARLAARGGAEGQRLTPLARNPVNIALMSAPVHPVTQAATNTATPKSCVIRTGVTQGLVNLRACGSLACGVVGALSEGEPLTVITAGGWLYVQTGEGVTGYVNSIFCK